MAKHFGKHAGRFLGHAFKTLPPTAIVELLHAEGVETYEEKFDKVFPKSNKATDVLAAFLRRFDLEHTFRFFKQHLGWTAPRLRDQVRGGLHLRHRVCDRDGEAAGLHHRQVRQVVAHEGAGRRGDAERGRERAEARELVGDAEHHVGESQLLRARGGGGRIAAGEQARDDAGRGKHLQAVAVEDVERLVGLALRAVPEPAVGEHAVHVEERETHAAGAVLGVHRAR